MYGQIFLSKILGRQYRYLAYKSIVDLTPKSVNKRNIHAQFMGVDMIAEHENIRKQNASKFVDQIVCFRSNGLQMTAFCVPQSEKGRYNFCL